MVLPLTVGNVLLSIKELLHVWICQIIYFNEIYPEEIFDKCKSFDLIVYKCRNPSLNVYIEKFINEFISVLVYGNRKPQGVNDDKHASRTRQQNASGGNVNQLIVEIFDEVTTNTLKSYKFNFSQFIDLSTKISTLSVLNDESRKNALHRGVVNNISSDSAEIKSNGYKPISNPDVVNDPPAPPSHDYSPGFDLTDESSSINIPGFTWKEIYAQFKSLLYFHILELTRVKNQNTSNSNLNPVNAHRSYSRNNHHNNFFRLLVNLNASIDLTFSNSSTPFNSRSTSSDDSPKLSNWIKITNTKNLQGEVVLSGERPAQSTSSSSSIKSATSSNDSNQRKRKKLKFVPIAEVSIGFICFDAYNEYL